MPAVARHAGPRRYQRREPETTPLYAVLQRHLATFLEHARADDAGLPRFVDKELRRFLTCGILSEALCSSALGILASELQRDFRRRAVRLGVDSSGTGGVTFIQRHGSALNLNVHFHTLWLDGVFVQDPDGELYFRPLPEPSDTDLAELLASVQARLQPLLRARGLLQHDDGSEDPLALDNPTVAAHLAGAVQQIAAFGERAGKRSVRPGTDPRARWVDKNLRCHAKLDGFDLHAGVTVPGHAHARRETLFRYVARPALSHDRLTLLDGDRVRLTLKTCCSARLRLCSLVTDRNAARRILRHLGLRDHAPPLSPARPPPDFDHAA